MHTRHLHLSLLVLLLSACTAPLVTEQVGQRDMATAAPLPQLSPDTCPITQPPDPPFVPPSSHPSQAPYGNFWYGSDTLWTLLTPDGLWDSLPQDERGYGQKVLWFREGYDMTVEERPALTVVGQQLDGAGATFEMNDATNGHHSDVGEFMLTGVNVPSAGCWEITGNYRNSALSFVVWVAP